MKDEGGRKKWSTAGSSFILHSSSFDADPHPRPLAGSRLIRSRLSEYRARERGPFAQPKWLDLADRPPPPASLAITPPGSYNFALSADLPAQPSVKFNLLDKIESLSDDRIVAS